MVRDEEQIEEVRKKLIAKYKLRLELPFRCEATQGVDYTLSGTPGQVTIPAGQFSGTVTLHALNNPPDGSESAIMTLNPGAGYNLSSAKSATVVIND